MNIKTNLIIIKIYSLFIKLQINIDRTTKNFEEKKFSYINLQK